MRHMLGLEHEARRSADIRRIIAGRAGSARLRCVRGGATASVRASPFAFRL